MANVYVKRTISGETNKEGGYKQVVFFAPVDTFLSIKAPTASPTVAGDKTSITTSHTFTSPAGFISLCSKKHSVTTTTETTGDDGAQSLIHKCKFELLGDNASTLEQLQDLLNDSCIWLLKDQDCLTATNYVQFGDECLQPTAKISFDGKTTADGLKMYTIELTVKAKKFFYSGTVTEKV